tara:strand:- start:772 stop:1344 length:573 start_codon:yes stop_codon:yes gene_type:complete
MDREKRHINISASELRFADGEKRTLEGYASVFNSPIDLGRFDEVIERGAFARSINEKHDVRALVDHDTGRVVGRTKNGTLELREDNHGLFTRISLPDTQEGRDLATLIGRGDLDGMSFGFTVESERWEKEEKRSTRYIEDVNLFEVSVVAFPAYESTEVALRSMPKDNVYEPRKSKLKKLELELKLKSWQ